MSYFDFDAFSIEDKRTSDLKQLSLQLAPTQASLLILGEAGTGKTSLARYIFAKSRSPHYQTLECRSWASFDFTKIDGGTLLIEDLDCANEVLQNELIKLVEQGGPSRPRFISTSRRDIRSLVKQGQFRQDLFYKLAVVHLDMPRLEDRSLDFSKISSFILEVAQIIHGRSGMDFSDGARERLHSWSWPGNIRELENVIERSVVLSKGQIIEAEAIQFEVGVEDVLLDFAPGMSISELEKRLIIQTLELTAQNRTRAAHMLGISIRTLRNKLNEYKGEGVL